MGVSVDCNCPLCSSWHIGGLESHMASLRQKVCTFPQLLYGGLDSIHLATVRDSQQKREYQKKALEASKKAKTLNPNGWEVLYQRGLQLAEAGEVISVSRRPRNRVSLTWSPHFWLGYYGYIESERITSA